MVAPLAIVSSSTNSSAWSLKASPIPSMMRDRSWGGRSAHTPESNEARAAATVEPARPDEGDDLVDGVVEVGDPHGEGHALQPIVAPRQREAVVEVGPGNGNGTAHADVAGDGLERPGVPRGVDHHVGSPPLRQV